MEQVSFEWVEIRVESEYGRGEASRYSSFPLLGCRVSLFLEDVPPIVDTNYWVDFLIVEGVVSVPQSVVIAK